ncbi:hypothetical protein DSTSK_24670 [Desulforhabdus sp. TSK]|nr:hypothetical protein DSTSK_24670 [Desulforhabdus sp. TSK]
MLHTSIPQTAKSMDTPHIPTSRVSLWEEWLKEGFFARHETFCPRYGWLKKGYDGAADSTIFENDDAIVKLGVGKNMVRSIRFWCMAFGIIEPEASSGPRRLGGPVRRTHFGDCLLSDSGWDPFLEDPASLWLLHWQLFSFPITASAWSLAINLGHMGSFTLKDLGRALVERKDQFPALFRYTESSILKDASCFMRMYAPPGNQVSEEIECPFTHLGLLIPGDERQTYRFNLSPKSSLPDEIFLAACCNYARNVVRGEMPLSLNAEEDSPSRKMSLSLNRISYDFNAPGVVFRLSETEIGDRLERIAHSSKGRVHFVEGYGSRQLQFEESPEKLYWQALERYYTGKASARPIYS